MSSGTGPNQSTSTSGYLLTNQVTHTRYQPISAKHSFRYDTLWVFVELGLLERNELDVGWRGAMFGYGSRWGKVLSLGPDRYLGDEVSPTGLGRTGIRRKLKKCLESLGSKPFTLEEDDEVWLLTIPRYLGFEGLIPLSCHFIYRHSKATLDSKGEAELKVVVLEVHNTFGENHVYLLELGVQENVSSGPSSGYDHRWTFPRRFHVSPFNDREGFYTVSIKAPIFTPISSGRILTQGPAVKVDLHTSLPDDLEQKTLKLSAALRPTRSSHLHKLTTSNILRVLYQYPIALFLTMLRVLYHAWILHYKKGLGVWARPEPVTDWNSNDQITEKSHTVRWLPEGFLTSCARKWAQEFIRRRVDETGISVTLISGDPSRPVDTYIPSTSAGTHEGTSLVIKYPSTTKLFETLFLAPSLQHALLLLGYIPTGEDNTWLRTSEADIEIQALGERNAIESLLEIFQDSSCRNPSSGSPSRSWRQKLRLLSIPLPFRDLSTSGLPPFHASSTSPTPDVHPLDDVSFTENQALLSLFVLGSLLFLDALEKWVLTGILKTRFVSGGAQGGAVIPWKRWDRVRDALSGSKKVN